MAFRVDAAAHIGTGHLQRCLTLACALKQIDIDSIFFVREFEKVFLQIVKHSGFEYCIIGKSHISTVIEDESKWLGVSQESDAQEFINSAKTKHISALVIDHYSIDAVWEDIVKAQLGVPIIVIDDLANRLHVCDILIDQNFWPKLEDRYNNLVPSDCICLLGPKYALLKSDFKRLREQKQVKNRVTAKILVNFGGVGNFELWQQVIPALIQSPQFNYHIITGRLSNKDFSILLSMVGDVSHIYIEEHTSKMPQLMLESSFCLGACGSTVWERFCLGLNSALTDVAENQTALVKYLAAQELIDYLGKASSLTIKNIRSFLEVLQINDADLLQREKRIMSLVDGDGANRIAKSIQKLF